MKQKSLTKSILKLLAITAGIILLLCIALAGYFMNQTPVDPHKDHSLGNGLEYLGSTQSGCVTFCDSRLSFTYYYGTDMDTQALKKYFKKTNTQKTAIQHGGTSASGYRYSYISLHTTDDKSFSLSIYNDAATVISTHQLANTSKRYIVSIVDSAFETAKDAL